MSRDREEMLAELRAVTGQRVPQDDVHAYLAWFSCFQDTPPLPLPPVNCALKAQQNKTKKNRARNKQAKKARKKNRR